MHRSAPTMDAAVDGDLLRCVTVFSVWSACDRVCKLLRKWSGLSLKQAKHSGDVGNLGRVFRFVLVLVLVRGNQGIPTRLSPLMCKLRLYTCL